MLYTVRVVLSSPNDLTSRLCCVVRRAPARVLECRFNSHGMRYFQVNVFRTLCDLPCSTFFYHSSWGCFLCYVGFWHLDDTGQHNSASLPLDSILCKYKWKTNPFFQPLGWPHVQDSSVASSVQTDTNYLALVLSFRCNFPLFSHLTLLGYNLMHKNCVVFLPCGFCTVPAWSLGYWGVLNDKQYLVKSVYNVQNVIHYQWPRNK